jgi:hypothetical protein
MTYDNIVNPDPHAPKRLNNGVIISTKDSKFLKLWSEAYSQFNPMSWDLQSSIIPFNLAIAYPDLINIEWSRMSPISYGFQTAEVAAVLTCGIYDSVGKAILYPTYDHSKKQYTYHNSKPNPKLYSLLSRKLILHLTMSQVRLSKIIRKYARTLIEYF